MATRSRVDLRQISAGSDFYNSAPFWLQQEGQNQAGFLSYVLQNQQIALRESSPEEAGVAVQLRRCPPSFQSLISALKRDFVPICSNPIKSRASCCRGRFTLVGRGSAIRHREKYHSRSLRRTLDP